CAILLITGAAIVTNGIAQQAPEIEWEMCYGGSQDDLGYSIEQTNDGGYIVAGARDNGPNLRDFYIAKLNSTGSLEWEEMFGGTEIDYALEVIQTSDNGYVLMGNTSSNDGDVTNNHGGIDIWVVKLDNDGDLQWERSLGGSG